MTYTVPVFLFEFSFTPIIVDFAFTVSPGKTEVPKAQIEEGLEKALTDVVPFEPSLFPQAEAQGALITHMKAAKNTLQKLENLVVDLIGDRTLKKESADKGADGKKPLLGAVLSGLKKN